MGHILKQLGQLRPANTTAASLYSPGASTEAVIQSIIVSNTSGSAATYRIFVDDDGTTYDQTTALYYDIPLPADSSDSIEIHVAMNNSSGNLAVRTNTNSAITFTAFGEEFTA